MSLLTHGVAAVAIAGAGVYPRFEVGDFNIKSTHGRGLDWPISYDDVRPYYDRVQQFLGISGDANPLMTYMPRAQKAGARFQPDSHVTRVLTNKKGDRSFGVEYADSNGERHQQHADTVMIAAFTIENTRILLNSAPDGLGNSGGNGCNL